MYPSLTVWLGVATVVLNLRAHGYYFAAGDEYDKYRTFSETERKELVIEAKKMFYFGYDNYMKHAFAKDELDPIHCTGRGSDRENPSNININDVLGDYSLTLIDSLDTLLIMGNCTEFKRAVQLVIQHVSFNHSSTIQVFEATIRVLGGLLSAHLLLTDTVQPFCDLHSADYNNELLELAHDLASRLLPAFDNTATGIPHPRVNLQTGVPKDGTNETCTAGAGSLVPEFGVLGWLLNDPVYERVARRAVDKLWSLRSNVTSLLGTVINIQTGEWVGRMSGVGAGLDSFYEYLVKSFILFGDKEDLTRFSESYEALKYYSRKGRARCNSGEGTFPSYVNVDMKNGDTANTWFDSLQAAWSTVQLLYGDVEEAICQHAIYYAIWRRYGMLPERYNWQLRAPDVRFYPLRPELVESTYFLFLATKNPFYLHVGKHILQSINTHAKAKCGYATIHDVLDKSQEDRMESFFLSETCKYLYLLFDHENYLNKVTDRYVFTTEGHLLPLRREFRRRPWEDDLDLSASIRSGSSKKQASRSAHRSAQSRSQPSDGPAVSSSLPYTYTLSSPAQSCATSSSKCTSFWGTAVSCDSGARLIGDSAAVAENCTSIPKDSRFFLPLREVYLRQIEQLVGLL